MNTLNLDREFKWTSQVILNLYKDKITKRDIKAPSSSAVTGGGVEGYSAYGFFAYRWGGLDSLNGDPIGFLDKAPSKDYGTILLDNYPVEDLVYIGSLSPTLFGSIGNNFQWRRWSLATRIVFKMGYYFKRQSINQRALVNNKAGHSDYELRWQNPGDEAHTQVPSFQYPGSNARDVFYANSEVLATKGDHIRFQYVNFSYKILSASKGHKIFKEAQVFANVSNIGIIWKANKLGLDPDTFNTYDQERTYSIGTRIQF